MISCPRPQGWRSWSIQTVRARRDRSGSTATRLIQNILHDQITVIDQALAQLDRNGKSMAEIQIESASCIWDLAEQERAKAEPQQEAVIRLMTAPCKVAHDVSPYLYPTLQSIKHGGDEDAPPLRIETLSDHQLETLIARLSNG